MSSNRIVGKIGKNGTKFERVLPAEIGTKSVTKSANSSNDNQKMCSNCSDANVDLFTCNFCAIKQWPEGNGDTPKYYCSCCIMRCTKVGHKIRNLKGQEPLVCSEHKIVKSEYCQTCDVPVCFKCLPKHGKHEPNPLEPKASNRKRKIDNFAQNESIEVDNFAQNEIIEQQENDEDIFNKDPDEEELCDTENIEPDIHPQNEMIIEQLENDQDIFHIDLDEQEHYPTDDPNNVNIFANVEMEAPAVNSLKSTRRPVKRVESTPANKNSQKSKQSNSLKSKGRPVKRAKSTPANKNKSKQAKGTALLDPRDRIKVREHLRIAAKMQKEAASQQDQSMKNLEFIWRNYNELVASKNTLKQLVSLKFLRTALFTRR